MSLANHRLLNRIIAAGENDVPAVPVPARGPANPAFRLLVAEARQRGWIAAPLGEDMLEIREGEGEAGRRIAVFAPNGPNQSFALRRALENRELVRHLLLAQGLPLPEGGAFADYAAARAHALGRGRPQVMRPLLGPDDKRVTRDVATGAGFDRGWARATARRGRVMVEDMAEGQGLRLLLLGREVIAAFCTRPPLILGNGRARLAELVAEKNARRRQHPILRRHLLDLSRLAQGDYRPEAGEVIALPAELAGAGGADVISLAGVLHPSLYELARRAFAAFPGAVWLGLDLVLRDLAGPAEGNALIIGVEADPPFVPAAFASFGPPARDIAARLLDHAARHPAEASALANPVLAPAARLDPAPESGGAPKTTALLRAAAARRGLRPEALAPDITRIGAAGRETLFWRGLSGRTLFAARRLAQDRAASLRLLREAGLNVSEAALFSGLAAGAAAAPTMAAGAAEEGAAVHRLLLIGPALVAAVRVEAGAVEDVTDRVHPEWAAVAARAWRALPEAVPLGLDLRLEDISCPPEAQGWQVAAVTAEPDLALHHAPARGAGRDVAGALLDALLAARPR